MLLGLVFRILVEVSFLLVRVYGCLIAGLGVLVWRLFWIPGLMVYVFGLGKDFRCWAAGGIDHRGVGLEDRGV